MGLLDGKKALITGARKGIGRGIALTLANEGADVGVNDIVDDEVSQRAAELISKRGVKGTFHAGDVSSVSGINAVIDSFLEEHGQIDILVNNAAISINGDIESFSEEDWDRIMASNAKGVFLGMKYAIPEMRNAGGGSIINISSVAGLVGNHISAAYSASKGAVRLLTKSTAIQYAKEGIRCNSVHPGTIETPMTADMLADQQYRQDRMERTPLGRLGTAQDVAYGVLYLASDESSFVTGSELVIDGGFSAQ